MTTIWNDIKYGLRMLCKSPGFTAVAVISLGLGIGAGTAIFSLLNAVILRSLPVRHPHELRVVNWMGYNTSLWNYTGSGMGKGHGGARVAGSFPYATYRDFRDRGGGFTEVFAFSQLFGCTALTPAGATPSDGLMVSGNFFAGYGAEALIGRTLLPDDDRPGAVPAAVITYRWWQRQFGRDPNALGQTVSVNQTGFQIVGVLPRHYVGPLAGDSTEFYVPMSAQPQLRSGYPLDSYNHWWVEIMARLAPGADQRQAQASLEGIFKQTLSAPGSQTKMDRPAILLEDGSRGPLMSRQRFAEPIYVLLAAVGLVLLIACANLAGLLLARGAMRQHEYAIRSAVGGSGWRLIRQSLTESLILAIGGALLGLAFAAWIKAFLMATLSTYLGSFHIDARTDSRVLAFTLAVSVATALVFGFLPAIRAGKVDPLAGLKDRATQAASRLRWGRALVSLQVGLSLVLVVGAGLFVRTFANLGRVDPGFDTENLLTFRLSPGQTGYEGQRLRDFYGGLSQSLATLPGVRAASFSSLALLGGGKTCCAISIPGRPAKPDEHLQADQLVISDSFFSTVGISLLQGRALGPSDAADSAHVAVVNDRFVRTFFPHEEPVGRIFKHGSQEVEIVGVCADARYWNLREEVPPIMYMPYSQWTEGSMWFQVRSILPPLSLASAIRKAVAAVDRTIPLTDIRTQDEQISRMLTLERLFAVLCSFVASLALLLSCIGLYGLMAYHVARRTNEIGLRMALGARPRDVAWPVVRSALLMAGIGVGLGGVAAMAFVRLIKSQLYGVAPHDPVTLFCAAAILLAVAVLSAWLPARRAAKVDPMEALRCE